MILKFHVEYYTNLDNGFRKFEYEDAHIVETYQRFPLCLCSCALLYQDYPYLSRAQGGRTGGREGKLTHIQKHSQKVTFHFISGSGEFHPVISQVDGCTVSRVFRK